MKKKPKLKKLVINRKLWARGGKNGEAALLNEQGNMCCLGFACASVGFDKEQLKDQGEPGPFADDLADGLELDAKKKLAKKFGGLVNFEEDSYEEDGEFHDYSTFSNSLWAKNAVGINDDTLISDKMREYRLRPILRRMGFDVKFVGPTE